ncbi:MAG: hypothetical protein QG635_631, partial [Bacteroidota bacterium]|nr:hypothetical protein [Bacteroidota bacterium]
MNKNLHQPDELADTIEQFGLPKVQGEHFSLEFNDLMKFRIEKILLVSSLYDYYTIIEDGQLQEAIFNEYLELNLYYAPYIVRAYSGESALRTLEDENIDLIIMTLRLGDIEIQDFIEMVKDKYPDIPLVLLASHSRELQRTIDAGKLNLLDRIFIWSGDRRIFLAIIKLFEDIKNSPFDCLVCGVTTIILVEDSPEFYSAYLPLIYTEVMKQSQMLIEEGKNSAEKLLRQRARPKILLATNFEEAIEYYNTYRDSLLGVITDLEFKINGIKKEDAGIVLINEIKRETSLLPILLQTSNGNTKSIAIEHKVAFLDKNSRNLLIQLRDFMKFNFGFGDFIFRSPDGQEISRARNMRELRDKLKYVPNDCLMFHSLNNHFSHWLIARTQFDLAHKIRPVHITHFQNVAELREYLIEAITKQLNEDRRGIISVFSRSEYDSESMFQILGEGSLGGKARGLAFIDRILKNYLEPNYFPGIDISIPRTMVLGTDIFTQFMEINHLYDIALQNVPDEHILHHFLNADLPPTVIGDLREIIRNTKYPMAIRSSSLLEDAVYQPFAGIYATCMIPNSS